MVRGAVASILVLALLPIASGATAADVDETWSFDVYVGCQVGLSGGALLLPCGTDVGASNNSVVFVVEPGIHALDVTPTWSSEFEWGLDNVQVVVSYRAPCELPTCYSGSGMTWRRAGVVTLAPGETAHFDDAMLSSSEWSFAGVVEPTALRLSFVMGHQEHTFSGVYWRAHAEGTVTERYE